MLRLPSFITSLRSLVMRFTIRAEVARTWNTKRFAGVPLGVRPDRRSFAISAWPVVVCILAIIDHSHGNPLDDITGFQKTTVRVFHKKGTSKYLARSNTFWTSLSEPSRSRGVFAVVLAREYIVHNGEAQIA